MLSLFRYTMNSISADSGNIYVATEDTGAVIVVFIVSPNLIEIKQA